MRYWTIFIFLLIGFLLGSNTIYAQDKMNASGIVKASRPTIVLHGLIQYDFEFLKTKTTPNQLEDYSLKGQEFRRIRLLALGSIRKNIEYKLHFEFAGGQLSYKDVYIKFKQLPIVGGNFTLGAFPEPTGLEMATTGKNISFLERSMLTSTQNDRWNSGFLYDNFDLFHGKIGLELSYGFNGNNSTAFKDNNISQGHHIVTRLSSPIYNKNHHLVHLGIHLEFRKRSVIAEDYTLNIRPENHMGYKIPIVFNDLKDQNDIGFEAAGVFGSFSIQAEYEKAIYHTIEQSIAINSYYGFISYFITGESRAYKKGAFTKISPKRSFGALELVSRYSVFDYSKTSSDAFGNKVNNFTAGLNWYLNDNMRFMYNYVLTDFNKEGDNNPLTANTFRAQIDF